MISLVDADGSRPWQLFDVARAHLTRSPARDCEHRYTSDADIHEAARLLFRLPSDYPRAHGSGCTVHLQTPSADANSTGSIRSSSVARELLTRLDTGQRCSSASRAGLSNSSPACPLSHGPKSSSVILPLIISRDGNEAAVALERAAKSLTPTSITSQMALKRTPLPLSLFQGNACFAYFNKIWDIASAGALFPLRKPFGLHLNAHEGLTT